MARPTIVRMLGLGKKIKRYRTEANISQRKMAKLLGIPYSTYSNYENDNRTPDTGTLEKICGVLQITMGELIGPIAAPLDPAAPTSVTAPESLTAAAGEASLLQAFRSLNRTGQEEALKRVEELAEIPRYCEPETAKKPPRHDEHRDGQTDII